MSEFPFDDMITDLIRAAQNVATETEWGSGTKSAEKLLERTEHDLLDAIIALQKRAAELEARLDGADVDNVTAIAKNLNEMRLIARVVELEAALKAADEDAAALAHKVEMRLTDYGIANDAALIAHRARVNGKLEGGESVMDSPDKEAKG